MKLSTRFSRSKIRFDQENNLNLMLSLSAPKLKLDKRPPINMIVVLDISSSMYGDKIEYVRKSTGKLIDHLSGEDRLGVITFNHAVSTVFEPAQMKTESKDLYRGKVLGVSAGGCTNFSGAMLEALSQAEKIKGDVRIVILTDGQPTAGVCDTKDILELVKPKITEKISVSAFGYGTDHDAQFLEDLARIGKGNYAFIKNPDDALTAFARELGGLLSCYAQNLKLVLTPAQGFEVVKVLSDVDVEDEGGKVRISIPDLYSEETRHIVCSVKLDKRGSALPRGVKVVDVALEYLETKEGKTKTLTEHVKITFVKPGNEDTDLDKEVMEQVSLADLLIAQQEAVKLATQGNIAGAQAVLRGFATAAYVPQEVHTSYCINFSSQDAFQKSAHTRAANNQALRNYRDIGGSSIRGMSVTNSAMDDMVDSFTKEGTANVKSADNINLGTVTSGSVIISNDMITTNVVTAEEKKSVTKKRQSSW